MSTPYPTADPRASRAVRNLLTYLRDQTGKSCVSGQVDQPDLEWVAQNTGKTPAILGLDFMRYPAQMGKKVDDTRRAIDWSRNRRGIVTFQWHWVSPTGAKNKEAGFNTRDTDFDLDAALKNPKSADYAGLIRDIDDVAAELKILARADTPILFRPLHEAQGKWFWWGAKGAAPCVALYKLMFRRLTDHHKLHNLAWVWTAYPTSAGKGDPAEWYPGHATVDVIAADYLDKPADHQALVRLGDGKKIVALAETMNAPDPTKAIDGGAPWAYWVSWARRDWNAKSPDDMKAAMGHPRTVTLETLPDLRAK